MTEDTRRVFESKTAQPARRGRWLIALALILAGGVGVLAYADRLDLREIGKKLSTVRETSIDAAQKARVRSALGLSRRVSGMKIDVDAHSGVVTLAGRVPTQEARSIIEAIAADTPGVAGVRNELVIDPRAATTGYEETLLQRIADLEIQVALQERLRREPLLASASLKVDVDHGVVVLRGWVESELERAGAQKIAQAAVGADHVRNEIDTRSPTGGPEDRLARRVEFELYSTGAFDLGRIQVRSEAGLVHIEGSVRSQAERLLAARLAEVVPGVRQVVNDLTLTEKSS
jgi:hyperosmotically inducible protein